MNLLIDPSYPVYYQNALFDLSNSFLNRDDTLKPYSELKQYLESKQIILQTFDQYNNEDPAVYWSMGVLQPIDKLLALKNLKLDSFFIFEPPLVAQHLYDQLPILTKYFDKVYVHNIVGDGYSLENVDQSKLKKLFWPQPHGTVLQKYWQNENRKHAIAMICGLHKPSYGFEKELYSKRIQALLSLSPKIQFDLYGRGWGRLKTRAITWWPYISNYRQIMNHYHGEIRSKYETYSQYEFSLCFENLLMKGYITEKIFDCFYAGTIPIYLGATDIDLLIPKNCYILYSDFSNQNELIEYLNGMSTEEKQSYRNNAKAFLESEKGNKFHQALIQAVADSIDF